MPLTPTSARVLVVGGVICAGTLWCVRPTKDQAPDDFIQFGQYMVAVYAVTLPVAFGLAGPSTSRSDTLAMHAGIVGLTAPVQLVAFAGVYFFVEFCKFVAGFGK